MLETLGSSIFLVVYGYFHNLSLTKLFSCHNCERHTTWHECHTTWQTAPKMQKSVFYVFDIQTKTIEDISCNKKLILGTGYTGIPIAELKS